MAEGNSSLYEEVENVLDVLGRIGSDWLVVGMKDLRSVGFGPQIRFKYYVFEVWITWATVSSENKTTDLKRFIIAIKFNL